MSLLVWPPALATFIVFSHRTLKSGKFAEALPLLLSQLNTVFIWICMTAYSIGVFNFRINQNALLKEGDNLAVRDKTIVYFLSEAVVLEPFNIFLYTWRFLEFLEKEGEILCLQKFYRLFAYLTIILIPLGFYPLFTWYVIEQGKTSGQSP